MKTPPLSRGRSRMMLIAYTAARINAIPMGISINKWLKI